LLDKVTTLVADLKTGGSYSGYDETKFAADLEAGTVDTGLLTDTMDFSEEYKRHALKLYQGISLSKIELAKPAKEIDWAYYSSTLDPDLVAEVKKISEKEKEAVLKDPSHFVELDANEKTYDAGVNGAGGLMEVAKGREVAAQAGLVSIISDLEVLETDIANLKTMTIAEILENEPELRKELEAEIAEHNWAP